MVEEGKVHDFILVSFLLQRGTMRRRYEDDGISDDEIEGKRTFDLEEKLHTNKYNANFVTFMEGKGQYHGLDPEPLDGKSLTLRTVGLTSV